MTYKPPKLDPADKERIAHRAVGLLKGLANENRLMIMCVLCDGELSVSELNGRVDLSQSALSQHLARLRGQGLVDTRRVSQTIYYKLADSPALELIKLLRDEYCPT